MVIRPSGISLILILILNLLRASDFETGLKNYQSGNYRLAQILLDNFLRENPTDTLVPEATYYLIKIYDQQQDLINLLPTVNSYLSFFPFHHKRYEVCNLLLQHLIRKNLFPLAWEYLKRYEYLEPETSVVNTILVNLGAQGWNIEELLSFAPENESLKILKAVGLKNWEEKIKVFKELKSIKRKIYLIATYLAMGDTINAWWEYINTRLDEIPDEHLYRWALFSVDLRINDLPVLLKRMEKVEHWHTEQKLLRFFCDSCSIDSNLLCTSPEPEVVCKFLNIRHLPKDRWLKPAGIDTIFQDTSDFEHKLLNFSTRVGKNFYLDSLICEAFLKKSRYQEAYAQIKDYLPYSETKNFVRLIRAQKAYSEKNYRGALKDLILASFDQPYLKFIQAECMEYHQLPSETIYWELSKVSTDSLLRRKSLIRYIDYLFRQKAYSAIAGQKFELFSQDTIRARYYLLSLLHTGKKQLAESLYLKTFGRLDQEFYQALVIRLVGENHLSEAEKLIDSLVRMPEYSNEDWLFYHAGLVLFRRGDYLKAESSFAAFIKRFKNTLYYPPALFKMGTLKYLKQDFDSAAFYYGLALKDSTLRLEAAQNRILALKKAEKWDEVIKAGNEFINVCPDSLKAEVYFEIGYANLKKGIINTAIDHLKKASKLKPEVNSYFWLAEAYLGKGDFLSALYYYQKIVNEFKKDDLWYPTALFKTALALEMMDEIKEAKLIYKRIIKEMGTNNLWSIEAQNRLEKLP